MPASLNLAMVGSGFMGKAHAMAHASMPMFFWPPAAIPVRKVLVDVNDDLAREGRDRLGYAEFSGDWRATVARPDIDAVVIVTPNDSHAEIAIAAARAGKHILCEKPLARDGDEAKTMLDAAEQAGIIHMVAFNYRRTPAVALARRYIDEGRIGRILNFRATYLQDWSADASVPATWRHDSKIAGSGTVGDIGTHAIDFARYLAGEIVAVNALVRTYVEARPRQQPGAGKSADTVRVDVDDEMITLVKFASGAVGSIEATRNAHGRNNFLTFEIHGEAGSIAFNYERRDELQVMFADDPAQARGFRTVYSGPAHPSGELWPIPALGIGYCETKIVECRDFVEAVVSGRQPSPNFRDGYRISRVADAILASGKSETWTTVAD